MEGDLPAVYREAAFPVVRLLSPPDNPCKGGDVAIAGSAVMKSIRRSLRATVGSRDGKPSPFGHFPAILGLKLQ